MTQPTFRARRVAGDAVIREAAELYGFALSRLASVTVPPELVADVDEAKIQLAAARLNLSYAAGQEDPVLARCGIEAAGDNGRLAVEALRRAGLSAILSTLPSPAGLQ